MKKKRHVPWFWRRQVSCPDCGFIVKDGSELDRQLEHAKVFDCPRCKVHYTAEDFWEIQHDKYSFQMVEENN